MGTHSHPPTHHRLTIRDFHAEGVRSRSALRMGNYTTHGSRTNWRRDCFDYESAPIPTQTAAPTSECAAYTRAHQRERRHTQLRAFPTATVQGFTLKQRSLDLLMVTAGLIEAACRANDSDGTRAHIGRAAEVLDGRPGPRVNRKTSDRGSRQTPRGGFAASQSRRLPAHVDATSLSRSSSRTLLRHSTSASATFVGRSSTPARSHPIEERISEPVYPGTTKPIIMAKARRLGRC